MRKFVFITLMSVLTFTSFAQSGKIAYMYSEKVFKSMPEYQIGIKAIEQFADYGTRESQLKLDEVEKMFNDFKEIAASMTTSVRDAFKREIVSKEKAANDFRDSYFEKGGLLEKKQQEIMKPIEDKVLRAVNAIADEENYDMIFDLSTSKTTVYQRPSLDVTDKVINRIKQ